jgi:Rrf2 family protein
MWREVQQAIPPRFLEVILGELKQAGFLESRRGAEGGYRLIRAPESLTVEEVIRFIEGPIGPVHCVKDESDERCPLRGSCAFMSMWREVQQAMTGIYRTTTFQRLVDEDARRHDEFVLTYSI